MKKLEPWINPLLPAFIKKAICLLLIGTLSLAGAASPLLAASDQNTKKTPAASKNKKEEALKDASVYPRILIGRGDVISVLVYGEQNLAIDYEVDADGIITYPFIGQVFVGGLTPSEASAKLNRLLRKSHKVTVLIKASNTYWVSVLGCVGRPGKYQIKGRPTLLSALAETGGPLPNSDLGGAILIHNGYKTKVDLGKYLHGDGKMLPEPYLYPGDILAVPENGLPRLQDIALVLSIIGTGILLFYEIDKNSVVVKK